jgi:TonB family protein
MSETASRAMTEAESQTVTDFIDSSLPADSFLPVDSMPVMLSQVTPVYPKEEKAKGVEATVWVKALVGRSGTVLKATIFKADGASEAFQKATLDAARQSKFRPALAKGKPVAVWVTYRVAFVLSDKKEKPSGKSGESK